MKLRDWRKLQNLSLIQVGDLLGASEASVSRWETGIIIPSGDAMQSIVDVTGGVVTPNDFYRMDAAE